MRMALAPGWMQAAALASTLVVEAAGMALLARRFGAVPRRRAVLYVLGVNLVVHPLFWLGHTRLPVTGPAGLWGAETIVVVVEGLCYAAGLPLSWRNGLALSLLLNLASYSAGLALWAWWS
jgi:hypothetical protein